MSLSDRLPDRLGVGAPPPDRGRDRIEARVFAQLDAIRAAERASRLAVDPPPLRGWHYLAAIVAVAAAVTLVISIRHEPSPRAVAATAPSAVATAAAGSAAPAAIAPAAIAPAAIAPAAIARPARPGPEIAPPATAGVASPAIATGAEDTAVPLARRPAVRSSRDAFQAALRLEAHDRRAAARAYRAVARGDDAWAALALYSLAELDAASGRRGDALATADEYLRRFPRGAGIEDVLWIRVEALRGLGRPDDARRAAASYLRQFPRGTYVRPAARVAAPR